MEKRLPRKQVGTTQDEEMDVAGPARSQIQSKGNAEASKLSANTHGQEGAEIEDAVAELRTALGNTPRAVLIALLKKLLEEDGKKQEKKPKKKKAKNKSSGPTGDTPANGGNRQSPMDVVPGKMEASKTLDKERNVDRATGSGLDCSSTPTSEEMEAKTRTGQAAPTTCGDRQLDEAPSSNDLFAWHQVTYKKASKRPRVDTEAKHQQKAKQQPKRYVELKVRPAKKMSLKPHIQSVKAQCVALLPHGNQAVITFHHIEKANVISVRTDSEDLARQILGIKVIKINDHEGIDVQVFRTYGSNYTKGIIYDIYPKNQDENDHVLNTELVCEKINIVAAHRLGKTNTAVITFDGNTLPRSIFYGNFYKKVYPHRPKAVVCNNCQKIGHKADICYNPEVCGRCGRRHEEDIADQQAGHKECEEVSLFCQECRKTGHMTSSKACPTKVAANKKMREDQARYRLQNKASQNTQARDEERATKVPVPPSERVWADKVAQGQAPKPSETSGAHGGECKCGRIEAKLDKMIMQWENFMTTHKSFFPAESC